MRSETTSPVGSTTPSKESDLIIHVGEKEVWSTVENLKNTITLNDHLASRSPFGAIEEQAVDWGYLMDEMGYPELLAARMTLKSLGMLTQHEALGSPGGIWIDQTLDLRAMLNDVEREGE